MSVPILRFTPRFLVLLALAQAPTAAFGQVIINEILQNPAAVADSSGEWFELYNPTAADIDINGWTLADNGIDNHTIDNGGPLIVPAGGYLVLGNNTDSATNGGATVAYSYGGSFFLANGDDELVLYDSFMDEVDRVEWDGGPGFPDPNGASMALADPSADNNDGGNWCTASTPFGNGDLGTPGAANDCPAGPATSVVINEVDADQVGTDAAEFVELFDGGAGNMDLGGLALVFFNGSNDLSYAAFDLDGFSTGPDGYFVLCGDAANVANCDLDVAPDTNLIQNGADAVALYSRDASEFPSGTAISTDGLVDAIVYDTSDADDAGLLALLNPGQPQVNENGNGSGTTDSSQRCPNGNGGARNTDTFEQWPPTAGAENLCAIPFGACGDLATPIHMVQGSGAVSPLAGTSAVTVEGIVTGDFQASDQLRGFFVQEEASDADGDALTSEGLFVFDNGFGADVVAGDVVRVQGTVTEFFGLTELTGVTNLVICGSGGAVAATLVNLPVAATDAWEAWEGMLVTFPQELFVSGNFTLARFGEVDLAVGGPLDTPTNVVAPGAPAIALQAANDLRRIQLDDGSTVQNPLPLPPYLGDGGTLRVGDSTTGLTGVLSYSFDSYEVHPTAPVTFARLNERPDGPPASGPALATVAGFNVLNYFTTLDDGVNDICGPAGDQECRGADSVFEFERQKDKLLAALSVLDADVVGVIEIENAPGDGPISDLVDGLNDIAGAGTFDYVATGAIGTDAIRVGLIYQPAAVSPVGAFAILNSSVDPDFLDTRNRPALAQTFQDNVGGEVFTVVVNHLKSKGSDCDDIGDVDTGDGQGNCNGVRTLAAQALVDWLATDPTASGDPDFLIIGDLNAYAQEDPIVTIEDAGYVDLIEALAGSGWADGAYTYSFEAQSGYLDHALASDTLAAAVGYAGAWHINADEPAGLDYNSFNQPGLYAANEFRSSDHDAVLVALYPDDDEDGVWNALDACPGTTIPESVPERELNPNHYALVDGDGQFDTLPPPGGGEGPGDAFDLFDTAGCSCEQIIEAWELGKGHRKFGCSVEVMREWQEHVSGL